MGTEQDNGLTLKNLTEKLADVFSEFFGIGLQLGIDESKLKEFEHNYQSAGRRFSEVISYWLRRNTDTPVTWESLITVLKSRSVNQKGLAQSLEEQYIVKSNPQIASTPTQKGVHDELFDSAYGSQPQSQKSTSSRSMNPLSNTQPRTILFPPPPTVKPQVNELTDPAYESQPKSQKSTCGESVNPSPCNNQPRNICPPPCMVKPLYELTEDGNVIATSEAVFDTLREFGHNSFRPGQEEAIMNILSGVSTLAILPVCLGKSICYQIPAYLYSKHRSPCITLVISPLISLMKDQVHNFPRGLRGTFYHANLKKEQRKKVLSDIKGGKIDVLLLSPEALMGGALWGDCGSPCLEGRLPKIAFACIDEAHCVVEWSHNFRPAYFRIQKVLKEQFGDCCVLGLTATATHTTALSVANYFGINSKNIIKRGPILPKNLHISVSCENNKRQALVDLIKSPTFLDFGLMIVYCNRRNKTETIVEELKKDLQSIVGSSRAIAIGYQENDSLASNLMSRKRHSSASSVSKRRKMEWSVRYYHGGMKPDDRDKAHEDFMNGKVHIMVATEAFGLGLNKKDVRAIIHYDMPKSIELYVQEVGRAGRDGQPAYCHAFIDETGCDLYELRKHVYNSTKDKGTLRLLLNECLPSCQYPNSSYPSSSQSSQAQCDGQVTILIEEMERSMDIYEACIATLLCYLEKQGYLEIKHIIKDKCTLKCDGGPNHLTALAKKVPVVAAAVEKLGDNLGHVTFSISEVAKVKGLEKHNVYRELNELQYNDHGTDGQREDGTMNTVLVEFSNSIYYVHTLPDLSSQNLDSVCEVLSQKVKIQEEKAVEKLILIHGVFQSIKLDNSDSESKLSDFIIKQDREINLRDMIHEYFTNEQLDMSHLCTPLAHQQITSEQSEQIENDVHLFVFNNQHVQFTGRAIARIFYGLQSPLFPAMDWGCCGFWRKYLQINFDQLCEITTKKLAELTNSTATP